MRKFKNVIIISMVFLILAQLVLVVNIPGIIFQKEVFAEDTPPTPTGTATGMQTATATPTAANTPTATATCTPTVTCTPTPVSYALARVNEFCDSFSVIKRESIPANDSIYLSLDIGAANYKLYIMQHPTLQNKLIVNLVGDITFNASKNHYDDKRVSITQYYFKLNGVNIPYSGYIDQKTDFSNITYMYFAFQSYFYNYTQRPMVIEIPKKEDNTVKLEVSATAQYSFFSNQLTADYSKIFTLNFEPYVNVINYDQNSIYGEQDSISIPSICVSDKDNDNLTCRYYLDSEPTAREEHIVTGTSTVKTVTFNDSLNSASISQGGHQIRLEVNDGKVKITKNVFFKVDKSSPKPSRLNITSTDAGISVVGAAKDIISGLDTNPYCFTVGGTQSSSWISGNSYITQTALVPNTQYPVKFEARDKKGNILSVEKNYYTKAQTPSISASNITTSTANISFTDSNPAATKYQIIIGDKYVDGTGVLTTKPVWITLTSKQIGITGLSTGTSYTIKAKARNNVLSETDYSNIINISTL